MKLQIPGPMASPFSRKIALPGSYGTALREGVTVV